MKERILHAAVKAVGGFICIGRSHADCFFQGKNLGLTMSKKSNAQGFMTNITELERVAKSADSEE